MMVSRFVTNLVLLLASAFVVVGVFALSAATGSWLAFCLGCLALVISLSGFAVRDRGALQRGLDMIIALGAAWLIVATRAYPVHTARWLGFALAAGFAALAVLGLLARELVLIRLHALPRTTF